MVAAKAKGFRRHTTKKTTKNKERLF